MPLMDSIKNTISKSYTLDELEEIAKKMRSYSMIAITAANSGHTGGTMSIIDITTALYFAHINHDPSNPSWEDRDRVFWSVGHKAPALYAALGLAGYFDPGESVKLRRLESGFEGHPNRFKLPGIEASSGSLGQGLGIAVGSALRAKLEGLGYRVFCIMGDGEMDEGSIWEAAMSASHYRLDNICAIIDRNNLQIDGATSEVMEIEPLAAKWESFGWAVLECDGHDIKEILETLQKAATLEDKPVVIIANTVKGKCVSFAENVCGYHGVPPKGGVSGKESLEIALNDIGSVYFTKEKVSSLLDSVKKYQEKINTRVDSMVPVFSKDYFWNLQDKMKVEMVANRMGFGAGLEKAGEDERVVALGADITDSIRVSAFYANHPERKNRFFSMGIETEYDCCCGRACKRGQNTFYRFLWGIYNWPELGPAKDNCLL